MKLHSINVMCCSALVLVGIISLSLNDNTGKEAPGMEGKAVTELEPLVSREDNWLKLRCDIMSGMLHQLRSEFVVEISSLRDGKEHKGEQVDRMIDLFETLGEVADVLLSVRPNEVLEYCFRGQDNALLVVGHQTLAMRLIDKIECQVPAESTPWGRQIKRLVSLENSPSAKLYLGGIPQLDMLNMQLIGKRLDCEKTYSETQMQDEQDSIRSQ